MKLSSWALLRKSHRCTRGRESPLPCQTLHSLWGQWGRFWLTQVGKSGAYAVQDSPYHKELSGPQGN
jgi:hypothetical protein